MLLVANPTTQDLLASCDPSDSVAAWVYVSGPSSGDIYQVRTADPTDAVKSKAVGVITAKLSTTTCLVRTSGVAAVFSGLTPGRSYYVGADGLSNLVAPSPDISNPTVWVQAVGRALDATHMTVDPSHDLVVRAL